MVGARAGDDGRGVVARKRESQDVSAYLDEQGVAVPGGHHCAQPILRRFGKESTVRVSLAPHDTTEDLDVLVEALWRLVDGQARGAGQSGAPQRRR